MFMQRFLRARGRLRLSIDDSEDICFQRFRSLCHEPLASAIDVTRVSSTIGRPNGAVSTSPVTRPAIDALYYPIFAE